jgi:hypothetical protein
VVVAVAEGVCVMGGGWWVVLFYGGEWMESGVLARLAVCMPCWRRVCVAELSLGAGSLDRVLAGCSASRIRYGPGNAGAEKALYYLGGLSIDPDAPVGSAEMDWFARVESRWTCLLQ